MPLLIFDLDGTLIDSRLDLAHAVNATRAQAGRGPLPHEQIFSFVGNGAPVLIKRAMGPEATEEEVANALEFFLDYYRHHALDYTVLYPGVRESLERLNLAGTLMAILTNKPVRISRRIIEALGMSPLFFRIYGGNSFDHKKPHRVGVDTLRTEAQAAPEETWMVGDSYVDVQTARNAGVASCGVTYGFQPETFREFPPDVLVDRMEELADRFIGS
ncbi:MAG TPA: HAD hydrolase-like protein [Bryobacteraceae bacterium]|jgi:phosphoglycolate phosphatase|nr:HAD hydrolase-like protein [Bryobacteraceae bacterium]